MRARLPRAAQALTTTLVVVGLAAPVARAQAPSDPDLPRRLEEFGEWRALAAGSGEDRSCYVTPKAVPPAPAGRAKDRPLLYVTHRPGAGAYYVVSYFAGYAVKPGSEIELDFGVARFRLFTQDGSNAAWAPSAEMDLRIVDALKAGWSVTARGVDATGAEVSETIPLGGFSFALWRASQECQVR
ncbi:MAG TPA: hypothetical protein VJ890_02845 [Vineibacter sp.]|nr:hypothetical protein [Vineibacter sp.]